MPDFTKFSPKVENKTKQHLTDPIEFKLYSDIRSKERQEFDNHMREKLRLEEE